MLRYAIRRLLIAIPTLIVISFVIFAVLDLAPNDPTGNLPLTIDAETRAKIREAMGLDEPFHIRYAAWLNQFFINEPLNIIEKSFDTCFGSTCQWEAVRVPRAEHWAGVEVHEVSDRLRIRSWGTRSEVVDLIVERAPQTLKVVGLAYVVAIMIALPIGILSAIYQYSWFDQIGTFVSMVGFSVPTFFTGLVLIVVFSTMIPEDSMFWLPSVYDTTHEVTDWDSFVYQVRQMAMPVAVLGLFNAAQISRYMRASMLENLNLDYVRTARAKGMKERVVILVHVLRNSLIPVVTVIAIGIPATLAGAIITEQIFRINGIGALLITGIQGADIPLVQTITFIFAVLIVFFNLIADLIYGILDPRIRYD